MFYDSHKKLRVWQEAMNLVVIVYRIQQDFPKYEMYALCDQLRRAVVSVCCNIAEGNARQHEKERKQFFYIALGSLAETQTLLEIAIRLQYIASVSEEIVNLSESVSKMLSGLIGHRPSAIE